MVEHYTSFEQSLNRFSEVLNEDKTNTQRDAAIKRFELTYELAWKTCQAFLKDQGIICNSPKEAFKEAYKFGLLIDGDEWVQILKDRNLSIHTYSEELAKDLYSRLNDHQKLFTALKGKLQDYV